MSVIKGKFFELLDSVLGCQALRAGSLLIFLCFQFASGMSQARELTQVGL